MKRFIFGSVLTVMVLLVQSCGVFRGGTGSQSVDLNFNNPLVSQAADPWIHRAEDGTYYFIATSPKFDKIVMRKSQTLNGIADAEPITVWNRKESGPMGGYIWAPELHRVDGRWIIYVAAGNSDNVWHIRMYALSNTADDPTTGVWVEEGQIETQRNAFALDATTFEHRGERYLIWAEATRRGINSGLVMAKLVDGVRLEGPEIVITEPEYDWERHTYAVNEGAAVIKRNGKIFVTFSASATDHTYSMGLLWADEDADLMDPASWNKLSEPVFYTNEEVGRYGPGHNGFTVAEDGKTDILVYHAREYKELRGSALDDPGRDARLRVLYWDENGFPDFRQELGD